MKILTKIAKVNIKILALAVVIYSLLVIPKVLAMSFDEVVTLRPYGLFAIFFGLGSAVTQFAQRQFVKIKRGFDIVVAAFSIILTIPILIVAAGLIKIFSPKGSVFYSQKRVGKNGYIFKIYKLRTMKPDAEKNSGAVWADEDNDPRVIPIIGNLLRKTHIDEIPQFFNVLKGDMSVIGPRPERPEIVSNLRKKIFEYDKRLNILPGITGLAQVRHRYDRTLADVKKKVKLDLMYMRNICLLGELRILILTLLVVVRGKVIG